MNTIVTPDWIVNETALRFMNSVKGAANFNRTYDKSYRQAGAKVGYTVQARLPVRTAVRNGQAWAPVGIVEQTTPVTLNYQKGYDFDFATATETMEVDRIRERYVEPAADMLASIADSDAMTDTYTSVWNAVGSIGTTPSTNLTYLQAKVKIADGSARTDELCAILDPLAEAYISNANQTLFNPVAAISENYKTGSIARGALGIKEWYMDQNVPKHTTGTFTSSTPAIKGAGQTGSTLDIDGWASNASSLKKGDVFTINGVNSVNLVTRQSTGRLQQFVVTADYNDTTGEMAALPISPSIITSGVLQTVDASPADNAAVNVWGNTGTYALSTTVSPQSLVFDGEGFAAFVMADLVEPRGGVEAAFARSEDWGISIRYLEGYLITSDQQAYRLDILYGASPLQPRFCTRVVG